MPRSGHVRPSIPDRVERFLDRRGIRGPTLVAVSGGADSVALLMACREVGPALGVKPIVAHFDHGLRPVSAADAGWVQALAEGWGVDHIIERNTAVRSPRSASEESSRKARYDFLVRGARACSAGHVLTAHTADDQTETILFNILRGTGLRGLAGMQPVRNLAEGVYLARPFLEVRREDIERFLAERSQQFLQDASNEDRAFARNRLRRELLPLLRSDFNPQVDRALLRLAAQSREASADLRRRATRLLDESLLESSPQSLRLDCLPFQRRSPILIRETIAVAWRRVDWPEQAMTAAHWESLVQIVRTGGRKTLPGAVDAVRLGHQLLLRRSL